MKKGLTIKNIICLVIALASFAGIVFILFYKPRTEYEIVILGDSNIGNFRDETGVTWIVQDYINKNGIDIRVFNGGFGGSTATDVNEASLINLAKSIVHDEFSITLSKAASRNDGDLTYYDEALRELSQVDFSRVQLLVLAYGTNDQLMGKSVSEYVDAMDASIGMLHDRYPNINIVVVTPFYNEGEGIDKGQPELVEYVDALISKLENKEFVYIYDGYNSGIVTSENIETRTLDTVHLSPEARRIYGEELAEVLLHLF